MAAAPRDEMLMELGRIEASMAERERIHDAITRGDADGARSSARDHVYTVRAEAHH